MDQASRSCTCDTDFILTAHRSNAQHLPMRFNTRARWTPWQAPKRHKVYSMRDRQALITCRAQNEDAWSNWAVATNQRINEQTTIDDALQELCRSTTTQLAQLPRTATVQVPSLHQDAAWTKGVANMWMHYRAMRNLRGAHTRNIFQAWRHMTCFQRASRTFRKEARARKRYLVDQFFIEAGECTIRGDIHQWYRRIRYICPKAKMEKIHLQDANGALMSPEQSIQCLQQYNRVIFHDPTYTPEPLPALPRVPFSVSEIEAAIHKLPVRKAALPELPPAIARKAAASGLAARIHQALQRCWCHGPCRLPAAWYKSTLCLLPKPGKSPTHPKALRPISLRHPICKILDGLAVERMQQEQPALLSQLPCFAYIKHRSAEDCLLKASAHCRAVQSLLKQAQHAPHLAKPSERGGLQLCVDLSQAFDRVSRQLVESSVRSAGYSAEVETARLIWLHGGTFQIDHKGQTAQVPCSRGVKQGSRGGPHMWSLVTRYVCC